MNQHKINSKSKNIEGNDAEQWVIALLGTLLQKEVLQIIQFDYKMNCIIFCIKFV